jgi:hypothetical protein
VSHDVVLVLVYAGSYSAALELRSVLDADGIRSSFDDIPMSPHGLPDTRIYVALGDVQRALALVADFRAGTKSR